MPTPRQWAHCAVLGALLLLGGNGSVMWAEQRVPSGIAALLIGSEPFWIVGLQWLFGGGRPTWRTSLGLVVGALGVVALVGLPGSTPVDLGGVALVVFGGASWALGSFWSNRMGLDLIPRSAIVSSATQMLCGGGLLLLLGLAVGEPARLATVHVSGTALAAFAYLVVFGSIVTFNAYVWLVRHEPPARVATYAFVNPVVAVFLGWLIADEPLTRTTLLAAAIICIGVALVVTSPRVAVAVDSDAARLS